MLFRSILVPDGQLHFVPFAALVDRDGRFWGESKRLSYMSSCRDILRKASPLGQGGSAVLLGNPDYQNKAPLQAVPQRGGATEEERHRKDAATELKRRMGRDFRDVTFGPLEGTEKEVAGLKQRFDAKGWQVRTLLDADASEPALQRLTHPAFLHLATHGFFLDEFGATKTDKAARGVGIGSVLSGGTPAARDPMMRSGLALSGAQTTVTLWQKGEVPPLEQDGILAAAEAAGLDLGGTFLVTLSACDTGLGEARSGEGVMGMKRGLALAGAENLLMTLWPISDLDTVALMAAFYDRVLSGEHPARALHSAQMEAMVRLRRERGLYRAITLAAPFVLVGGTALP